MSKNILRNNAPLNACRNPRPHEIEVVSEIAFSVLDLED